ncbi:MAG: HEAT repeat domain-containing protein, partial [Planctomycetes bacterium]|nr:HEAT repeat domain-containing protein [Planctomycetota bacterium]
GLKDRDPAVRSAAALALLDSRDTNTVACLLDAVQSERSHDVLSDLFIVLGLKKGMQSLEAASKWAGKTQMNSLVATAKLVVKVLQDKTDVQVLEGLHRQRIAALSAQWNHRFYNRVMEVIHHSFELDRIIRKAAEEESGNDTDDGTGVEDPVETPTEGDGDGGADTGTGIGDSAEPAQTEDPLPSTQSSPQKKFLFRREVLEWDLLLWLNRYPYFPESFFEPAL